MSSMKRTTLLLALLLAAALAGEITPATAQQDSAAAPDSAARDSATQGDSRSDMPGDTAGYGAMPTGGDSAALRDTVAASDTSAVDTTAGDAASLVPPALDDAQCRALRTRMRAGEEPPADATPAAVQSFVVPEGEAPADASGPLTLEVVVAEDGLPDLATLRIDGSTDDQFRQRVRAAVERMAFVPAQARGCTLPSTVTLPIPVARR